MFFFFLMIRRPPRSTLDRSSAASDVYKRQVSARALLLALLRGKKLDLEQVAKPPVFVPENTTGRDILESYRQGRTNMAFVVDE